MKKRSHLFFLILKKLKYPIISLVVVYLISMLGLTIIPGVNDNGQYYNISFFDAFYIVSYTATTIGFGELPFQWTNHQRVWMLITIYTSVICWLYAIGSILSLFQSAIIKNGFKEFLFLNKVKKIKKPFYIICGYGATGRKLVQIFNYHDIGVVVIDKSLEKLEQFSLLGNVNKIPHLASDASEANVLIKSGIKSALCKGVIAITGDDDVNLKISMATKILSPKLKILSRGNNRKTLRALKSFNLDYTLCPSTIFTNDLKKMLTNYEAYKVMMKLTKEISSNKIPPPPPKGKWIICGYNEFSKKIYKMLKLLNIDVIILAHKPQIEESEHINYVDGSGMDKSDLLAAGIGDAQCIAVCEDTDLTNLSSIITAKEIKGDIFTIVKQNSVSNEVLFGEINIDILMKPETIIARRAFSIITEPALEIFENKIKNNKTIVKLINDFFDDDDLIETWNIRVSKTSLMAGLKNQKKITLKSLMPNLKNCKVLMVIREFVNEKGEVEIKYYLMPKNYFTITPFDTILYLGDKKSKDYQHNFICKKI